MKNYLHIEVLNVKTDCVLYLAGTPKKLLSKNKSKLA